MLFLFLKPRPRPLPVIPGKLSFQSLQYQFCLRRGGSQQNLEISIRRIEVPSHIRLRETSPSLAALCRTAIVAFSSMGLV